MFFLNSYQTHHQTVFHSFFTIILVKVVAQAIFVTSLFAADVSGNNKVKNTVSASNYEEVSGKTCNVYETAFCSDDTHVYEGLREMKD